MWSWWWLAWLYDLFGLSGGLVAVALVELLVAFVVLGAAVLQAVYFVFWVIFRKEPDLPEDWAPSTPSEPLPFAAMLADPRPPEKPAETIEDIIGSRTEEDREETRRFLDEVRRGL